MKKWILGLIALLIIALLFIYVFIPGKINISTTSLINGTTNKVNDCLHGPGKWVSWWPEKAGADSVFLLRGFRYEMARPLTNGADIRIVTTNDDTLKTNVFLMSMGRDSTAAEWRTSIKTSINPIKRVRQYYEAVSIRNNMKEALESLHGFANNIENIYGLKPRPEKVKFDFLMSKKQTFNHYPSTEEIYGMSDAIEKFVKEKNSNVMDHPFVNVKKIDSLHYLAEVALATDKELKDEGVFTMKWMLKGGNMLVADVKGGPATVEKLIESFTEYVNDRRITIMAIPFQSLVTDRRQEPDTSKWETKIYYPVL